MRSISSRIPKKTKQNKNSTTHPTITKYTYFVFQIRQYWEPDGSLAFGFHCTSTSGLWPNQTNIKNNSSIGQSATLKRERVPLTFWAWHIGLFEDRIGWGSCKLPNNPLTHLSTPSAITKVRVYCVPHATFDAFPSWVESHPDKPPLVLILKLLPNSHKGNNNSYVFVLLCNTMNYNVTKEDDR